MKNGFAFFALAGLGAMITAPGVFAADLTVVYEVKVDVPPAFSGASPMAGGKSLTNIAVETTAYYKGHKSRSETGDEITLTDYDAGMTYTIDTENKTYSVAQVKPAQADTAPGLPGNKSFVHSGGQTQTIAGHAATNTKFMSVTQIGMGRPSGTPAPAVSPGMLPTLTLSGEEWMADGLLPEDARNAGFVEFSKRVPMPQLPGVGGFAQKMLAVKGFPLATTLQIRIAFPAGAGPALVNAIPP